MKTFRLKSLIIIYPDDPEKTNKHIPLLEGLIIDREDEQDQWIIEAFTDNVYMNYFKTLHENNEEINLCVKITKESNAPAYFLTKIISIQDIGDHMNVVFKGEIIDRRENDMGNLLAKLINQGIEGEELLSTFKKQVKIHR